ncbi:MAG: hypothetical protein QM784_17850 [Polyangiaceae bacterium]
MHRNLTFVVAILANHLAIGCMSPSSEGSGTTGKRLSLQTRLAIKDDLAKPFQNSLGWNITISKAFVSVGALYYYSGDPVLSQRSPPSSTAPHRMTQILDLFVGTAHAHPGHYIEGAAMGQMTQPQTVDLLGGAIDLADGEGVSGSTNSATFTWQTPPHGDLAPALDGQVILTQGTATKDGATIQFVAKANANEVLDGDKKAEVAGCAFGSKPGEVGVEMNDDGTVTLTMVPSVWFNQVDFDYVVRGAANAPLPNDDGVVDIAGTLAWQGFVRGIKKGTAYEFAYTK